MLWNLTRLCPDTGSLIFNLSLIIFSIIFCCGDFLIFFFFQDYLLNIGCLQLGIFSNFILHFMFPFSLCQILNNVKTFLFEFLFWNNIVLITHSNHLLMLFYVIHIIFLLIESHSYLVMAISFELLLGYYSFFKFSFFLLELYFLQH